MSNALHTSGIKQETLVLKHKIYFVTQKKARNTTTTVSTAPEGHRRSTRNRESSIADLDIFASHNTTKQTPPALPGSQQTGVSKKGVFFCLVSHASLLAAEPQQQAATRFC